MIRSSPPLSLSVRVPLRPVTAPPIENAVGGAGVSPPPLSLPPLPLPPQAARASRIDAPIVAQTSRAASLGCVKAPGNLVRGATTGRVPRLWRHRILVWLSMIDLLGWLRRDRVWSRARFRG